VITHNFVRGLPTFYGNISPPSSGFNPEDEWRSVITQKSISQIFTAVSTSNIILNIVCHIVISFITFEFRLKIRLGSKFVYVVTKGPVFACSFSNKLCWNNKISCRSQWPRGLRRRLWSLGGWDRVFISRVRHVWLSSFVHYYSLVILSLMPSSLVTEMASYIKLTKFLLNMEILWTCIVLLTKNMLLKSFIVLYSCWRKSTWWNFLQILTGIMTLFTYNENFRNRLHFITDECSTFHRVEAV
jgi:hypothetical protein